MMHALILLLAIAFAPSEQLRSVETKVVSVAGSTVQLADARGLAVGDRIIIESTHGYGESGLDGVYEYIGSPAKGKFYYTDAPVGKSFIATIVKATGKSLTLDRDVPAAAVGKTLYRDNDAAVKYAIENHLPWPKNEKFAVACYPTGIRCYLPDDQETIDFNGCELFSPRGVPSVSLSVMRLYELGGGGPNNKVFKNLTLHGNARSCGFGMLCERNNWGIPTAFALAGTSGPQGRISKNLHVEGFQFIDNFDSLAVQLVDGATVKDCLATFTDHQRHYIQWEFIASSCTNVVFKNCRVDSDFARPGFEAFKSTGVQFIECGGRNTAFSCNSSGDVLFDGCSIIWDQEDPDAAFSPYNPLMSLNRTIEEQDPNAKYGGGTVRVRDFAVEYRKLPFPGRIFNTINISPGYKGVSVGYEIRGVSLKVPTTKAETPNLGYLVRSDDPSVKASGFKGDQLENLPCYVKQNVVCVPDPYAIELNDDEARAAIELLLKIRGGYDGAN